MGYFTYEEVVKMDRTLKVFIACVLGAGIGTLVALQLHPYLLWIGLVAGGLVGYLSYEFKTVCKAIPLAWKATSAHKPNILKVKVFFSRFLLGFSEGMTLSVTVLIFVMVISLAIPTILTSGTKPITNSKMLGILLIYATIFSTLMGVVSASQEKYDKVLLDERLRPNLQDAWMFCPVMVYGYWLPKGVYKAICFMPKLLQWLWTTGVPFVGHFIGHLFILIHSDIRLLCGIDAAIGTTIGYFTGSVIIGALVGGIVGVVNYEIVSKHILHLIPTH